MDNTKVLCYSPESDISPIYQNLEEVLSFHMLAAWFFFSLLLLRVAMRRSASGGSQKLRWVIFTRNYLCFVGWIHEVVWDGCWWYPNMFVVIQGGAFYKVLSVCVGDRLLCCRLVLLRARSCERRLEIFFWMTGSSAFQSCVGIV